MKYFSLFSGIGGLEYGLKDIGELVGYSEIKKSSIKIFENHFKGKNYGDITKIVFEDLPDFNLLLGGFPCQSFSLVGLRKGFEDERGKMIFRIYDLLKIKKPNYFVLENVKGLYNHCGGKTFVNVIKLLKNAGYFVRVLLLNACNYGSAQNRERLIFLGSLKDFDKKEVIKIDDNKRFRDFREKEGNYKFIKLTDFNLKKIRGERKFNFELIGGYDRVGTLTTQYGCGEKLVQEDKDFRFLTIKECERLQGFSDDWTKGVGDNDRYFALGNAVSCNMSNYLFGNYLKGLWY